MKMDVLSGTDPVRVCTGYQLDGKMLDKPHLTLARRLLGRTSG